MKRIYDRCIDIAKYFLSLEFFRYLIAGGSVTVTNAAVFFILFKCCGVVYTVANVIGLVLSKTVGYFMNKFFVYRTKNDSFAGAFFELCRFVLARGFTGVLDFVLLIGWVELLHLDEVIGKCVVMIVVIVVNYVLGKKAVFIKTDDDEDEVKSDKNDNEEAKA